MFKLEPNPTFLATVQITEPGGQSRPLKVHFKHQTSSQLKEFLNGRSSDADVLARMVDRIDPAEVPEGMTDADFIKELFEKYPASSADMLRTYLRELTESRIKN